MLFVMCVIFLFILIFVFVIYFVCTHVHMIKKIIYIVTVHNYNIIACSIKLSVNVI